MTEDVEQRESTPDNGLRLRVLAYITVDPDDHADAVALFEAVVTVLEMVGTDVELIGLEDTISGVDLADEGTELTDIVEVLAGTKFEALAETLTVQPELMGARTHYYGDGCTSHPQIDPTGQEDRDG